MYRRRTGRIEKIVGKWGVFMSAILKQKLIDIANGFTKYGLWNGGGGGGGSSALSDMTDVTLSDLQVNNILKYNGIVWVNDDNLHEYSTEEKIVGKWIDGKPIYEKVIINNITWSGDSQQNVQHGIFDLDKIITWQTIIGNYSLPYAGEKTYQLYYNETNLVYKNNANWNNYELKTIIQYTKTTD